VAAAEIAAAGIVIVLRKISNMPKSKKMMAASVMFHLAGVNKQKFMDGVRADPQTYKDWGGGGEWNIEIAGEADHMFSLFIKTPFEKAIKDGCCPRTLTPLPEHGVLYTTQAN
jgi:hypothetical protein